jgi:hypothetical protein
VAQAVALVRLILVQQLLEDLQAHQDRVMQEEALLLLHLLKLLEAAVALAVLEHQAQLKEYLHQPEKEQHHFLHGAQQLQLVKM